MAEWWWIAPAAAGAGTVGWIGVRNTRRRALPAGGSTTERAARTWANRPMSKAAARRLELDAALLDQQNARHAVTRGRAEVKIADAEVMRAQAERAASRASSDAVVAARARLTAAQRELRAASAEIRARRAAVRAAKSMLPAIRAGSAPLPVARLFAEHDAILQRWMAYETDPALAIDFPAMSDSRSRLEPADFLAYRDAVRALRHAFERAERAARHGRDERPADDTSDVWGRMASEWAEQAQRAVTWSMENMGRAASKSWTERQAKRGRKSDPGA